MKLFFLLYNNSVGSRKQKHCFHSFVACQLSHLLVASNDRSRGAGMSSTECTRLIHRGLDETWRDACLQLKLRCIKCKTHPSRVSGPIVRLLYMMVAFLRTFNVSLGGAVVQRVELWTLRSVGRGFKSYSRQRCVTTFGKLFTPMCLCHQAV